MTWAKKTSLAGPLWARQLLDVPLQRPQLAVGEAAGEAPLQVGKKRLRFQSGVDLQLRFESGQTSAKGSGRVRQFLSML
jgi:hypothetical protein